MKKITERLQTLLEEEDRPAGEPPAHGITEDVAEDSHAATRPKGSHIR